MVTERIEALDVLRGFALLGILLMNILGFGLHSAGYFNPLIGTDPHSPSHGLNMGIWALLDLTTEGAMRALFSVLFGAGVVLFTTGENAKSRATHYRRQVGLLLFGLFNGFVLLWVGDILVVYALCGMLLYPLRHWAPRRLVITAAVVMLLQAGIGALTMVGLGIAEQAQVSAQASAGSPEQTIDEKALANDWQDFANSVVPQPAQIAEELTVRRGAYPEYFAWNAVQMWDTLVFVLPFYLLWDALMMMLLGMALMRWGILSGTRTQTFYRRLCALGFAAGLLVNGLELSYRIQSGYAPLALFGYFQPSYHLGRLLVALGWLGAVMLFCQAVLAPGFWLSMRRRLAAVGRLALSNYLLQSLLGLLVFSGLGFGLVGRLERWELYLVVLTIWALQLWLSRWWLARHRYGPAEWLWRRLTYVGSPI